MANKKYNYSAGSKSAENVKRNNLQARRKADEKQSKRAKIGKSIDIQETDRNFSLNTYIDVANLDTFLRTSPWISHYCYTTHDKDVWTADDEKKNPEHKEGTPKKVHTHVLLYTYSAKTSSAIKKNFDRFAKSLVKGDEIPLGTMAEICKNMVGQYRYQLHLDDKDKYQYLECERHCDDFSWWRKFEKTDGLTTSNTCIEVINDIRSGASSMELAERYGKDYVYHITHYKQFFAQVSREEYLNTTNDMNIGEYFSILLEGSNIPQERINAFFECLEYIKAECIMSYNTKLNFYLEETKQ